MLILGYNSRFDKFSHDHLSVHCSLGKLCLCASPVAPSYRATAFALEKIDEDWSDGTRLSSTEKRQEAIPASEQRTTSGEEAECSEGASER